MNKLDEIFEVEENQKRLNALLEYAKSLKINIARATKPDGEYSEHQLAVLIFDAEQNKRANKMEKVGLLIVAFFVMAVVVVAGYLFFRMTG